eukprot:366478-Chlamydomonas_euryale.AAC.5
MAAALVYGPPDAHTGQAARVRQGLRPQALPSDRAAGRGGRSLQGRLCDARRTAARRLVCRVGNADGRRPGVPPESVVRASSAVEGMAAVGPDSGESRASLLWAVTVGRVGRRCCGL